MPNAFIEVDQTQFDQFLVSYPRTLRRDVCGIYEPPLVTYNDFERAPYWPDSVVAKHGDGEDDYRVLADVTAPVRSSSKPDVEPLLDCVGNQVAVGDQVDVTWGYEFSSNGQTLAKVRRHAVVKHDVGTVYERWGISGCANDLRSMTFRKVA